MTDNQTSYWVRLNLLEMLHCANTGTVRHYAAQEKNRKMGNEFTDGKLDPLVKHIQGAVGELVVAKFMDRYFDPRVNNFKEADIGGKIQVRLRTRHDWDLGLNDDDNPNHIFVLVTGVGPSYRVWGWELAKNIMLPQYRAKHGAGDERWYVPSSVLKPFPIDEEYAK